jgi:tryptophan-rich sensory protein
MSEVKRLEANMLDDQNNKDNTKDINSIGIDGKYRWPIRLAAPILLAATIGVNYAMGINRNKEVSDAYHLYTTPPGYFFIVWSVIYTTLIISNIYNLITNKWNLKTHIYFGISNVISIIWTVIFNGGSLAEIVISSFVLFLLCISILLTWIEMGHSVEEKLG